MIFDKISPEIISPGNAAGITVPPVLRLGASDSAKKHFQRQLTLACHRHAVACVCLQHCGRRRNSSVHLDVFATQNSFGFIISNDFLDDFCSTSEKFLKTHPKTPQNQRPRRPPRSCVCLCVFVATKGARTTQKLWFPIDF